MCARQVVCSFWFSYYSKLLRALSSGHPRTVRGPRSPSTSLTLFAACDQRLTNFHLTLFRGTVLATTFTSGLAFREDLEGPAKELRHVRVVPSERRERNPSYGRHNCGKTTARGILLGPVLVISMPTLPRMSRLEVPSNPRSSTRSPTVLYTVIQV